MNNYCFQNRNSYFPINSINLMRGAIVAEKDNFERLYIDKFYNAFWRPCSHIGIVM